MVFGFVCALLFFVCFVLVLLRIEVLGLSNSEALAGIAVQLAKAKGEIVDRIAVLEAAVASGEDLSGPIAELSAVAQALDDVVPDVVPDGPVEG